MAQVPGGMLTNLENQLKDQNAIDRLDEVLEEIPIVRKRVRVYPFGYSNLANSRNSSGHQRPLGTALQKRCTGNRGCTPG